MSKKAKKNPAAEAVRKARAFFGSDDLVTDPVPIKIDENAALVELGEIVAIEYRSTKWDGKTRIFRHDVTKKRRLFMSTDGEIFIIKPGFKLTKRGIEG